MRRLAFGAIAVAALSGCAAKPPVVPAFRVDAAASELSIQHAYYQASQGDAVRLRDAIATHLGKPPTREGERVAPARFRARVYTSRNYTLVAIPCLFALAIFGCPSFTESATIRMDLEIDGKLYTARGDHTVIATLYAAAVDETDTVVSAALEALRRRKLVGVAEGTK